MPRIIESQERLEKSKRGLQEVFEKNVVSHINSSLAKKGLKVIKYLDGVVDEGRSKKIYSIYENALVEDRCVTKEQIGADIVTMGGG